MPEIKKTAAGANTQRLLDKLDDLNETLLDIQEGIDRLQPAAAWKRMGGQFMIGVMRGFGFVLGTAVLAAGVVLLFQRFFSSDTFQAWLHAILENAFKDAISSTISNF